MARKDIPDPPDHPAAGRSCDAGHCDRPSVGWRYFTDLRTWLPACDECIGGKGVPNWFRDYDDDHWEIV